MTLLLLFAGYDLDNVRIRCFPMRIFLGSLSYGVFIIVLRLEAPSQDAALSIYYTVLFKMTTRNFVYKLCNT